MNPECWKGYWGCSCMTDYYNRTLGPPKSEPKCKLGKINCPCEEYGDDNAT